MTAADANNAALTTDDGTETGFDTEPIRVEVRRWLAEHWDPDVARDPDGSAAWLEAVVDAGWAAPSWPQTSYGRGLSAAASRAVDEEFRAVGASGSGQDVVNLWANTLLTFGGQEIQDRLLRRLLLGQVDMCLLYSEPGAGSDLAGIQTRAERDGDEWVVNGQKVWTSGARHADYAMLIARTDWDVPKHQGITFFYLPMDQPGVEVRPLRQATGDSRFNEVFLTDAKAPDAGRLGDVNAGWRVLQTALAYERLAMGRSLSRRRQEGGGGADAVRSAEDERPAPIPDLSLVELAKATGRADDLVTRQRLARLRAMVEVNEGNGQRAKAQLENGTSSPIASLGKLAMSAILHDAGSLQTEILGAEGMIGGNDSPRSSDATYSLLNAFFTSIGGGTDQIQRNIIGERILGLPKEPAVDRDIPFRSVMRAGTGIDGGGDGG